MLFTFYSKEPCQKYFCTHILHRISPKASPYTRQCIVTLRLCGSPLCLVGNLSWAGVRKDSCGEESRSSTLLLQSSACCLPLFSSISLGPRAGLSPAAGGGTVARCGQRRKLARPWLPHSTVASPHFWGRAALQGSVRIASAETRGCNTLAGLKRGGVKYSLENLPCLSERFCLILLCFWFWEKGMLLFKAVELRPLLAAPAKWTACLWVSPGVNAPMPSASGRGGSAGRQAACACGGAWEAKAAGGELRRGLGRREGFLPRWGALGSRHCCGIACLPPPG